MSQSCGGFFGFFVLDAFFDISESIAATRDC
jgi:hypothetical protein